MLCVTENKYFSAMTGINYILATLIYLTLFENMQINPTPLFLNGNEASNMISMAHFGLFTNDSGQHPLLPMQVYSVIPGSL